MPKLGSRPQKELIALREVKSNLKQIKTMNGIIVKLQVENADLKIMIGRQKFSLTAKTGGTILKSLLDEKKELVAQICSICKKYRIELTEEDKAIMSGKKAQEDQKLIAQSVTVLESEELSMPADVGN